MKFTLLGGDARSVILCRLLRADGHTVRTFALEQALPDCAGSAREAFAGGADCVILPLPCEKNGMLNAPFSETAHDTETLLRLAAPGTPVCAGNAGERIRAACLEYALPLADYGKREDFALRNADLTAEGALALLLQGSDNALRGSHVLIAGFGRIGRALAWKLTALGASVTVAARSASARVKAELAGCTAVSPEDAPADGYDVVLNTVPAVIFHRTEIEHFGGARLIELASPPYGFDFQAAEALGKSVELASGLPGKTAPEAAAEAVKQTVYAILKEL